jgi:hypothetical protein
MACEYETDPLRVIRAALSQLAENALYLETESDCAPENPCPDYCAMLADTIRAIGAAQSFDELARLDWITGMAALGLDAGV